MLMLGYAVLQSNHLYVYIHVYIYMCVCVCVCIIPGGGHGHPLQYFCLENPMGRGAWRATVHRVAKSQMWLKRLSSTHIYNIYPLYFRFPYHLGHHRAMSRVPCVKQELRLKKIPPYFKISILVCFRKNCYFVKFVLFVMKLTRTVSHTFSVSD